MHPHEFWWMWEANRPPKSFGRLSESEVREIYEETYGPGSDQPGH